MASNREVAAHETQGIRQFNSGQIHRPINRCWYRVPIGVAVGQKLFLGVWAFGELLMMIVGLVLFYVVTFPWWLLTGVGYTFDHWQYFCFANCLLAGAFLGVRASMARPEGATAKEKTLAKQQDNPF
jgi:hypothetical protein